MILHLKRITTTCKNEARRHYYLKDSGKLVNEERMQYEQLLLGQMDDVTDSIRLLSELLCKHYGKKVIILIDEYDVPLDKAFSNGYYDEMSELIRGLLGQALKTNDFLQFAILTGCLRVSKESIFTGINNFKVKINDRRILREILLSVGFEEDQLDSVCISFDKLNKIKAEGVEAELTEKGFDKAVIAEFMKLLSNAPFTLDYVKEICKNSEYVDSLAYIIDTSNALADGKYVAEYDMTLVRGQGYYTGTVFEVESLDFNSSIAGGGRYDNLIGKFLKEQIPAVGFSIGFERIYSILMEKESYNTEKQKKVVLIYEEDQVADAIRYAEELRKTYKTALYIKPKKLGKFLNKLEEQGFDGFQVFGRDEEVRMFGEQ